MADRGVVAFLSNCELDQFVHEFEWGRGVDSHWEGCQLRLHERRNSIFKDRLAFNVLIKVDESVYWVGLRISAHWSCIVNHRSFAQQSINFWLVEVLDLCRVTEDRHQFHNIKHHAWFLLVGLSLDVGVVTVDDFVRFGLENLKQSWDEILKVSKTN